MSVNVRVVRVSRDFGEGKVEPAQFEAEVSGSSIASALVYSSKDGDDFQVAFMPPLSAPDIVTFNSLVTNHSPLTDDERFLRLLSDNDETLTPAELKSPVLTANTSRERTYTMPPAGDLPQEGTFVIVNIGGWDVTVDNLMGSTVGKMTVKSLTSAQFCWKVTVDVPGSETYRVVRMG